MNLAKEKVVEVLLADRRVDLNKMGVSVTAPLHLAVQKGHTDIVKMLVAKGRDVDINKKCVMGNTPLMVAISYKKTEIAQLLLADARISQRAKRLRTCDSPCFHQC